MKAAALIEIALDSEFSYWGELLANVNALQMMYQIFHWTTNGENYYQDHLLFERLYKETNGEIDGVAEKAIGATNNDAFLNLLSYAAKSAGVLSLWYPLDARPNPSEYPAVALKAETVFISFIESMRNFLETTSQLTSGVDNFLQGIADLHESHVYLLQQRTRM